MVSKNQMIYGSLLILILSLILKFHFHFSISSIILLIFLILILIILNIIRKFLKKFSFAGYHEEWNDLYGDKILNIPYFDKNNKIINSFKKNGINYNPEIGEINEGKDYDKTNRNYYDLFIPYIATKRKDKHNGVILFIHGGGWQRLKKEYMSYFTIRYAKYGYITAQLNYTFLSRKNKGCSIFRMMDEITACLENIKIQLKNLNFDINKLELAIGGFSSGAHLALLYGYSMKNIPFPLKFLINFSGPLSLEKKFWYKLGKNIPPLDNIESMDIEKLIKEKKIEKQFENDFNFLMVMNWFIGKKYDKKELEEIMNDKVINLDNEKYKELNKIAKYCYPTNFINDKTVPTLCYYGGMDTFVGIVQYYYLKKISEKFGNKVELVYMKNSDHFLADYESNEGKDSMREIHYKILNYAKTYFSSED